VNETLQSIIAAMPTETAEKAAVLSCQAVHSCEHISTHKFLASNLVVAALVAAQSHHYL